MEKTDKSMAELEIELNKNKEFSSITEEGSKLEAAYGEGLTGLENLGNTCYINSTMQVRHKVSVQAYYFKIQNLLSFPTPRLGKNVLMFKL